MNTKHTIKEQVDQVLLQKFNLKNIDYNIDYPPQAKLGDYSLNVAMLLAKKVQKNPLEIGEIIKNELQEKKLDFVDKIEVIKPGFINIFLTEDYLKQTVDKIFKKGKKFGEQKDKNKQKIQIEFISANPTGPLTLANGRGGFTGDVLANILKLNGHKVQKEYYVNDYGNQIRVLGHSVLQDKEAQYRGEYIEKLRKKVNLNQDPFSVGIEASQIIIEGQIKPAVKKMDIDFDNWFSEREMHEKGEVEMALKFLKEKNLTQEKDGAVWLKSQESAENEDKERVLVKSNGDKTYFLADIAYHWDKFAKRKFNKVINIWGADHHGYVARLKNAVALMGYPNQLEIILMQLVRLIKNGQEFKMSKREGNFVLIKDLIEEVGLDVVRFFFLMYANNKHMDFDLDLAKERSSKNPVFYVQYAHARICSLIEKAKGLKKEENKKSLEPAEKELIKELLKWPELVQEVADNYEVHKVAFYAISIADKFHDFYERCRVIENDKIIEKRLQIVMATQQVLQNVLGCLGVNAPQKM